MRTLSAYLMGEHNLFTEKTMFLLLPKSCRQLIKELLMHVKYREGVTLPPPSVRNCIP